MIALFIVYLKKSIKNRHITKMMCPTFLFEILGEMSFTKPIGSYVNLKKPYTAF